MPKVFYDYKKNILSAIVDIVFLPMCLRVCVDFNFQAKASIIELS